MAFASDSRESVWAEHESVIRRFEEAWAEGRPELTSFLGSAIRDPARLLVELIQIDLEFRFRAGERPRVEEYVGRFPDLSAEAVLVELLASELTLRDRHGPPYSDDELRTRFPHLAGRLDTLFSSAANRGKTRTPAGAPGRWVSARPTLPGYVLGDQLGRGGMGIVYRAEQATPARTVAVKTLLAVPTARGAARFRREAEAMARLDHPNIVPVYEVGEWSSENTRLPYFTMKWYAGGSLDAAPLGPGTPPAGHARTVELVARAVHHAHQRGVLHRDLKPSNILLDADDRPAVADFGLAGWFDPDEPAPLSESVVGTPAFMAPEQATDPSGVTTATDVYGLGAILYHQLTGRPPVNASTAVAAFAQLGRTPTERPSALNPAVPRDLETICLKCLEADPRNRYPTAEAVADDLARWRNGESITARRPGFGERVWRTLRRHPVICTLSLATAVAVVATIVTLAVSVHRIREKEAETAAALKRERQALYLEQVASVGRLYQSNHLEQAWVTMNECPPDLRQWEWHYLDRVRRLSGGVVLPHDDSVVSAAFLSDGRVVTAERQKVVTVWRGDSPTVLDVRGSAVRAHPTRPLLAAQAGLTVRVVEVDTGEVALEAGGGAWFDFTPDGRNLIVASGGVLKVFDTDNWQPDGELAAHADTIWAGVFSADGSVLYSGSSDKTVGVWDWKSRQLKVRWGRDLPVMSLSLSADGRSLFETQPSRLSLTDTETGVPRRMADVSGGRPPFLPTAEPGRFITTSTSGEVIVRTPEPGEPSHIYRGHVGYINAVAVSRDGKRAVSAGEDATARVWDLTTNPEFTDLAPTPFRTAAPVLSPDGRRVALVTRNIHSTRESSVPVRDTETGRELFTMKGSGDAAFDPTGKVLAVGRAAGEVILCDANTGAVLKVLTANSQSTLQVRFSEDGSKLATAEMFGPVRVWDTTTWRAVEYQSPEGKRIVGLGWSRDGRLALAEGDEVVIWNPTAARVDQRFRPANSPLVCVFSPDGKALAVAGRGRALELYDPDSGRRLVECIGNPSVVNGLAFHPSGRRLVSVGVNGFARVWDTATGKEVLTLNGGADLFGVVWSADGKHIYASGTVLRRWSADR